MSDGDSEDKSLEAEIASILKNHVSKRVYDDTCSEFEGRVINLRVRAEEAERKAKALEDRLIDSAARNNEHVAMIAALRQALEARP